MKRKEFLAKSSGAVLLACLGACSSDITTAPKVDFTLDLNDATYTSLKSTGGSFIKDGVIVINKGTNQYGAYQQNCTHEGQNLSYQPSNTRFYCSRHGATFNTNGAWTGGQKASALKSYNVTLTGNLLRIFS